jgi:hypothetical protein
LSLSSNKLFNILTLKLFKGILQSSACNIIHTTVSFRCSTCHIVLVPTDFILSDNFLALWICSVISFSSFKVYGILPFK